MKIIDNKLLLLFIAILFSCNVCGAKYQFDYEIESAGTGANGTYLVKVCVIANKPSPNTEYIKKCAIHGVLFRGFANKELRSSQKPLAGSALTEQQYADFFSIFFDDGGIYKNYANFVNTDFEIIKVGKKEYRITAILTIAKDQLYNDLVKANIIKGLNRGF
nr:hypothetical protein [Prevotella sp.]